jgi:hypothetical protein
LEIIIVRGGDKKITPEVCRATGCGYGLRDDYRPYHEVDMIDFNWKRPFSEALWERYLELGARHQPRKVMVPDYERRPDYLRTLKCVEDLERLNAAEIMICPKFKGAVSHFGFDLIYALSVPTEYAGWLPDPVEMRGRKIHLLGGAPDQWLYLIQIYEAAGATIISADSAFMIQQADAFGKYWLPQGGYAQTPSRHAASVELAIKSVENTREYLEHGTIINSRRVTACRQAIGEVPTQLPLFDESGLYEISDPYGYRALGSFPNANDDNF